ncbi:ribonuclease YeeF family protein [Peribacillus sp. NPDC097284]|uniref:ribonuclease YeeF family protein n=1 Tax=Peribacillus sp. NPDC097284 TaxID=3364401 RepID=UPI003820374D
MRTLHSQSLHSGIDGLLSKVKAQRKQANELEKVILEFFNLDDSLKGKGGSAIRSFYQDWHIPFLSFYDTSLKNYEAVLTALKEASTELESDSNGFIRQSFLEGELTTGLKNAHNVTIDLVDEANTTLDEVRDIVAIEKLNDQTFLTHYQRATSRIKETIDNLGTFDTSQTKELASVEDDIQLMNKYLNEIQGMFSGGNFNIQNYDVNQLKDKPTFSEVKKQVASEDKMTFGQMLTSPFAYINGKMSFGDNVLVGYQAVSSMSTMFLSKKLSIHYFGSKPTLWQKLKGNYEFSVKADPSWTSKGKHSSKVSKWLLDFSRSTPTNPVMQKLQKFAASYTSPSHMLKHLAGFPKNFERSTGKDLVKGTTERIKTNGTTGLLSKAAGARGLTSAAKRIPLVGIPISAASNLGEFANPENSNKSFSENAGRFAFGFTTDMVAIGSGAKIGATIGSIGGPVGIVIGGAVGGLAGGVVSSTFGDQIKDVGGKVGKVTGKVIKKSGALVDDIGSNIKNSVSSWFN